MPPLPLTAALGHRPSCTQRPSNTGARTPPARHHASSVLVLSPPSPKLPSSQMLFRFSSLPLGLRTSVLSQLTRASPRTRNVATSASKSQFTSHFFTRGPTPSRVRLRLLWLLPIAGGGVYLLAPKPQSVIPTVFASPTLIPCNTNSPARVEPTILSPAEPERRILYRILDVLNDKIWEPLLTGRRFIYLLFLFVPVLLSAPMILVGHSEEKFLGDRWGAVWWYGFLTTQMQRAGPTFVKVSTANNVSA